MRWKEVVLFLLVMWVEEVWSEEPDPEEYFPSWVEIRERIPAGVTDEWWMRVSKGLIWHVTPAFEVMPPAGEYEPYEIIRSATSGFMIRSETGEEWEKWPPVSGVNVYSATTIISVTQNVDILSATDVYVSGVISASAVISPKLEQSFVGNNSKDYVNLDTPAINGTVEILAITDPVISHGVEWVEGNHWEAVKMPGIEGAGETIVSVSPVGKWWRGCTYRIRYYGVSE